MSGSPSQGSGREVRMDQGDREILAVLEDGLPFVPEPFAEIGKKPVLRVRTSWYGSGG